LEGEARQKREANVPILRSKIERSRTIMIFKQFHPDIIKSIFQININKYSISYYVNDYLYEYDGRVNEFPDFNKLLNIINITKLYSIMINIKRHKYIVDESIIIIIDNIKLYDDNDNIIIYPDTYKKNVYYYYKFPYYGYEIPNNRRYGTKYVLLYINDGKYLNLANCRNYF